MLWNDRYAENGFAYGTDANTFLMDNQTQLPKGRILCLAEGEGRNAIFLAEKGYDVVAVDSSSVGLEKAQQLAADRGVKIETIVADLADFTIEQDSWDGIVSIFCHIPPDIRLALHQQVCEGLKQNGILLLEAYCPKQLEYKSGGPPTAEFMMTLDSLSAEFSTLHSLHKKEVVREIIEGKYHTGMGAVVQLIAQRK